MRNLRLYQNLETTSAISSKEDCTESLNIFLEVLQKISKPPSNAKKRIMYDVDAVNLKINKDYYFYILYQLIDNALKFSESYAKVLILGKKSDDEYIIVIRDFGNGFNIEEVNPTHQKKLQSKKKRKKGQGLAIFICEKIIKTFNGKIEIKTNKNEGTVISVILPLSNI
ncbi:MAG: ATP-binding protein [bacterium]|nr:ATP-binding protein [bacterium]